MDWQAIVWVVAALVAAAFVKWGIPYIKSKVDLEKLNKILAEVKELVELAEKLFGNGNDDLKITYVLQELGKFDFKVDDNLLLNFVREAMSALHDVLTSEGKIVPTNETAVKEYRDIIAGKKNEDFEASVLAASFNKLEDVTIKEKSDKKSATKK